MDRLRSVRIRFAVLRRSAVTNVELLVVAAISLVLLAIVAVVVGKIYELLRSWS